jgi:phage gp36-like protein
VDYCTLDDLRQALPEEILIQLTDDANLGAVDSDRTGEAIGTAGAEIDGWVSSRYVVPFASPCPALIRKCAIDLAIYNLYCRRVEKVPETREARYKDALRLLEKIASGAVNLGTTQVPAAEAAPAASFDAAPRRFTRTTLEGM